MNNKEGIVNIHGKDYMTVAKRVELWLADNKANNDGYSIETEVLSHDPVVVKAIVKWRNRTFSGISSVSLASLKQIEKQNPYEVAETSAVGRALGFAGYGLIESVASADEMYKAGAHIAASPTPADEGDFTRIPDEEAAGVIETYNEVIQKDDVPTVEAADHYKSKSLAALKVEISQLMNKGKIEKDFPSISKMTREQAVSLLEFVSKNPTVLAPQEASATSQQVTCPTCGERAVERSGTNKNGKPYHAIFCTSDDRSHTKWLSL